MDDQGTSRELSYAASRALGAISLKSPGTTLYGALAVASVAGIAAGIIPKKEKTARKVAMGVSVVGLAAAALLFAFSD